MGRANDVLNRWLWKEFNQLPRIICHAFYILLIKESCYKRTNCSIMCAQLQQWKMSATSYSCFSSTYSGLNISLTAVLFPLQSLSVCGQSHKVFDICTQFAWDIFLFQVRKDGNGFFFPQEWTSQSNSIFMVFVADWIIFHSLCSQLALGIESLPLKHDSLLRQFFFFPPFNFKDLATLSYSNVCIITFYCWP